MSHIKDFLVEKKEVINSIKKHTKRRSPEDKKVLLELVSLIEQDKYPEAYKFCKSMDTFLRTFLPEDAHSFIVLNRCGIGRYKVVEIKVKLNPESKRIPEALKGSLVMESKVYYPADADNKHDIPYGLMGIEEDLMKDLLQFEYSDIKTEECEYTECKDNIVDP